MEPLTELELQALLESMLKHKLKKPKVLKKRKLDKLNRRKNRRRK